MLLVRVVRRVDLKRESVCRHVIVVIVIVARRCVCVCRELGVKLEVVSARIRDAVRGS